MSCPSGVLVRLQNFLIGNKEVSQPNELSVKHRYSVWAAGRVMKALCLVEGSLASCRGETFTFSFSSSSFFLVFILLPRFSPFSLFLSFFLVFVLLPHFRPSSSFSSLFSSVFLVFVLLPRFRPSSKFSSFFLVFLLLLNLILI